MKISNVLWSRLQGGVHETHEPRYNTYNPKSRRITRYFHSKHKHLANHGKTTTVISLFRLAGMSNIGGLFFFLRTGTRAVSKVSSRHGSSDFPWHSGTIGRCTCRAQCLALALSPLPSIVPPFFVIYYYYYYYYYYYFLISGDNLPRRQVPRDFVSDFLY